MRDPHSISSRRIAAFLLFAGLIASVAAIGTYVAVFAGPSQYTLARTDGSWANFGSYLGGVLGPAFAFLAFAAVLVTVWLQARQLDNARQQSQLEEIQRVVSVVSANIDSLLSQVASGTSQSVDPKNVERTVFVVLAAGGTASLASTANYLVEASNNSLVRSTKDALLLQGRSLVIELQQLVWCLEEYEREGGSSTVIMFYRKRYSAIVCWLEGLGLADSERVQAYFKPKEFRQFLI